MANNSIIFYSIIAVDDLDLTNLLNLDYDIDSVELEIEFTGYKSEPQTRNYPGCEATIEINKVHISDYFCGEKSLLPMEENWEGRILDLIPDDVIELACWEELERLSKYEGEF